jgi:hypothetical protein
MLEWWAEERFQLDYSTARHAEVTSEIMQSEMRSLRSWTMIFGDWPRTLYIDSYHKRKRD